MSNSRFKSGVYFNPKNDTEEERARSSRPSHFPLLSVSIDAKIESNICTTVITQKYKNPASSPAEHTKYLFPIYDGSAATSFRCWIGKDKLLEGAVKPKQQARKEFAEAVSKHKAAVLVEELTPEIFETNLGQIPGQTDVTVEITLATQLKGDQTTGATTLTIPTSVAPRYGQQPDGYTQSETESAEAVAAQDALRISVSVAMPEPIKKIESHTHTISVDLIPETGPSDPCKASASLTGQSASLGKDFVLTVLSNSKEWTVSRAIAVPQPNSNSSTIALTLSPGDLFRKKLNPDDFLGEVIFIADRSGSMREEMPALRDVMNVFLRSLPDNCSFNIVSFGSRFSWLWEASRPYGQESLDEASRHVDSFKANYGRTEISYALESIPQHFNKDAKVPTTVIILTDGETWDVERVTKFVGRMASIPEENIRFFALGIGNQVSHRLVQGIGMRGGGCAEVISDIRSSLMWQGRVIQMLKNALMPSRLQCSISFDGLMQNGSEGVQIQAPYSIPPLNTFSHLSIYYMLDSSVAELPDTLTIKATTEDGLALTTQLPIQRSNAQSIHHLAAKAFMDDYETDQSWLHAAHDSLRERDQDAFNRLLEREAQGLGVKWSIPSRWTSYVAVDRTSQRDHDVSVEAAERDELDSDASSDSDSDSKDDMVFSLLGAASPRIARGAGAALFCRTASSAEEAEEEEILAGLVQSRGSSDRTGSLGGGRGAGIPSVQGCFGPKLGGGRRPIPSTHPPDQIYSQFEGPSSTPQPVGRIAAKRKARGSRARAMPLTSSTADSTASQTEEQASPELTLSSVLYLQGANGEVRIEGSNIEGLLVAEFEQGVMEKLSNILTPFNVNLKTAERAFLLNVLAVVYITVKCAESSGLWEMQINKARRYLNKKMQEAAAGEVSDETLGELEAAAAKELSSSNRLFYS